MKIRVFYCICAFCWYIKVIITVQKIHGMETLKIIAIVLGKKNDYILRH